MIKRAIKTDWIYEIEFVNRIDGRAKRAVGKIGRATKRGKTWVCPIAITGIGKRGRIESIGEDKSQALILALEGIRNTIRDDSPGWRWNHGMEGDLGIPKFIPTGFGMALASRLESLVDEEIAKFIAEAERRHNQRSR